MPDKKSEPAPNDASHLSDSDLQLAYERARADLQRKNQNALDASSEEAAFKVYNDERQRRSKSDLEKKIDQEA